MVEAISQLSYETSADLWERTLEILKNSLDEQIVAAYLRPLTISSGSQYDPSFSLNAPSKFICAKLESNYREKITEALKQVTGLDHITLSFSVNESEALEQGYGSGPAKQVVIKKIRHVSPSGGSAQANSAEVLSFQNSINKKYTFANFVVGNSNQFCHAAAMQVAEMPGKTYNPLFIYGGVGLGKTHLLHAIGNFFIQNNPRGRVLYLSSENFTNELIQALRFGKMDQFKSRFRNIELLMIDDIQFISGKERTQEEFFHTFNALYNDKRQIIITSDKIPQDIPGLEERLKTRFAWGLTADLQAPDFETRVAILRRKAALENFSLSRDVANFIADRISSNVRELEGALTRLHAVSSLKGEPISIELAESSLKPLFEPKVINISVSDIKKAVSEHFQLKVSDIISKRRTKNLSFPRQIAMYLCRKHTTASYPEIGGEFGGRDHSSVIHAANVVTTKLQNGDEELQGIIAELEKKLRG